MPVIALETLDDPRVADYQRLSDGDWLVRRNLFVAEGRLVVERVVASDRYRVQSMLLSAAALAALRPIVERHPSIPTYVCSSRAFSGLAGLHLHRGSLALVERPEPHPVATLTRTARTIVVLEAVGNPDNVGGIFRNAAAFGADAVLLGPGCADPLYRKSIRTSMGAVLSVPFAWMREWPEGVQALREHGFQVVALSPGPSPRTLDEFAGEPRPPRLALVLGAEGPGLSSAVLERADVCVRIPTTRAVDSLNVAVACAIALSRLTPVDALAT